MTVYSYRHPDIIPTDQFAFDDEFGSFRGLRVFTSGVAANGVLFERDAHIDRILSAAADIHVQMRQSKDELIAIVDRLLEKNSAEKWVMVRLVISADEPIDNGTFWGKFYIHAKPVPEPELALYDQGARLETVDHQRPFATIKLTNYVAAFMARHDRDMDFPLFVSAETSNILEGDTFNIFFVKDNQLVTPMLDERILSGITRRVVIEQVRAAGISVDERSIAVSDLASFDEAFLTSSIKMVMPIKSIDTAMFAVGQDTMTCRIQQVFETFFYNQTGMHVEHLCKPG